jgi:hypothetical protein
MECNVWGAIAGWVALVVSAIALGLGYSCDRIVRTLLDELRGMHERESERVDKLIEAVMSLSQSVGGRGGPQL